MIALQREISEIKAEMISKQMFASLESRALELEEQTGGGDEIARLRARLDRLNPAHRKLAFEGSTETDLNR